MVVKEEYKEKVKSLKGKTFTDAEYDEYNTSITDTFSDQNYNYFLKYLFEREYIENYETNFNIITDRIYFSNSLDFNFSKNIFFLQEKKKFFNVFKNFMCNYDVIYDRRFIEVLKEFRYEEIKYKIPVMFRI